MNVSYSIYDELIDVTWVTDEEDVYMNVTGADNDQQSSSTMPLKLLEDVYTSNMQQECTDFKKEFEVRHCQCSDYFQILFCAISGIRQIRTTICSYSHSMITSYRVLRINLLLSIY